ncbi:FIVAR domain-containing protein [Cryobacterium sp. BB307]|uniref:FIVAR domain-containing protein n=1 Tax=Cryobacterium sp. BB307 TaxID=2716317 RepID=UPI001446D156|nr:FIVAR domain-containing protein [Cryobacterium sp. BB307]
MHPSTRPQRRFSIPRLLKQAAVATLTGVLMFAGVAPAAAAPEDDLAALVAHAETLTGGEYTAMAGTEFFAALSHAKDVLAEDPVDEPRVSDAFDQLSQAISLLVDLSTLRSTFNAAVKTGDFTAHSWTAHEASLNHAAMILSWTTPGEKVIASKVFVDNATAALIATEGFLVDLSGVRVAYRDAPKSGDYTFSSWTPHQATLTAAARLLDDATSPSFVTTQWYADAVVTALTDSEAVLVDLSRLRAQTLAPWNGEYTDFSHRAYSDVLNVALEALDKAARPGFHISQANVDTLTADLVNAYNALADLSGLRHAYSNAMLHTRSNYLTHGWVRFEAALSAAADVLAQPSPTTAEVAAVTQNLIDTQSALVHSGWLHEVLQTVRWKDEADYGAATWARFMDTVAVLEALAVRDLAGDLIPEGDVFDALNDYYTAEAGLLETVPLHAAADDFASLDANHYATVAFAELAAIAAGIDRVIADSGDPAKMGVPGDEFLLPRYWAKKDELADIRALTALFDRIDVASRSHTAHSVAALRSERFAVEDAVENHRVTDADVEGFVLLLEALENALVSVTPLEDSLIAAAALDERLYEVALWSELATGVAAGKLLLADTADPNVPITRAEIASAAQAITDAIHRLEITPPLITVGGLPAKDGLSVQAGAELTIAGERVEGGSVFRAELHSTPTLLGSVTAGIDGTAVLNVRIPANTPAGKHTLHVFGTAVDGTPIHLTVAVTIVAGPGASSNLPRTGADLSPLHAGGGLIAVGVLLILSRRRWTTR